MPSPPVLAAVEPPPRDKLFAKPVLVLLVGNAAGEAAALRAREAVTGGARPTSMPGRSRGRSMLAAALA